MKFNSIVLLLTAALFIILTVSTGVEGKVTPKPDIPTTPDGANDQQTENQQLPPPIERPAQPQLGPPAVPDTRLPTPPGSPRNND
ncbi:uncharacterized protein LOC126845133 isoform X4 [Adelges cooleyi]|uniref:uncharacterized protein LOC126845133 isoform X3 n=1 Tax=Adelges cooleyi TaxID=133065 RepID=UPI0021800D26|nr:uncharacterized protein LOC126845133 isoform X3 [Adelges cooleyi]XP_050439649.1 uncharacterized protein LOC126845133 isoform X4 [Adelges cooleyi]